jgi:DNA-binding NtrC family response regulator
MKKNQSSILIVGHDEHLLATRQWVLQTRGYQVVTVQDPAEIRKLPASAPVRLIVLCHTLSDSERETATRTSGTRWPGVKSLTLMAESGRMPSGILGQLLHTMDGPGKLLSMVTEAVGSSADLQRTNQL